MTIAWGDQERRDAIALVALAACWGLLLSGFYGLTVLRVLVFVGCGLIAAIFVALVWFLVPGRRISDYVVRLVLLNLMLAMISFVLIYLGSSRGDEGLLLVMIANLIFVLTNIMFFCLAVYRYTSSD